MNRHATQHRTLVLGRRIDAPTAAVFELFTEPRYRQMLGQLGGKFEFYLDEADFQIGGSDRFRFGKKIPRFRGQTVFHDITPQRRIITTDVIHRDDERLSITTMTLDLSPQADGTHVTMTAQIVALPNADLYPESTIRSEALLDTLYHHFSHRPLA